MDFIDLQGASGSSYRFRLLAADAFQPPIAGNYVFVRKDGGRPKVLLIGESGDLSKVQKDRKALAPQGAHHLYVRLNISRATRAAEHEDLSARLAADTRVESLA